MSTANTQVDPRAHYERAADQLAALIEAVGPGRWEAPTPCTGFDVRALVGHVVAGTRGAAGLGRAASAGGAAGGGGAPEGLSGREGAGVEVPDDGWAAAYAGARAELLAAWADGAALAAPVRMPWGEVPGRQVLAAHVLDVVAHAWDLARALGDGRALDEELAEFTLGTARQLLPAARRGAGVPFGPALSAPEGATAYEELAAWLGRDARWSAPGPLAEEFGAGTLDTALDALAARLKGDLFRPGDAGYDAGRATFNSAVQHRPALVAGVADATDVATVVAFAGARGLPVAVQSTGHGQAVASADGVLITTRGLGGVSVDPAAATAWIGAGVRWGEVVAEAARHGLAPLNGSAPHVGVVGYLLGGGVPLLARSHGFAADRVRAIEVVTPDATPRRVTPTSEPDLFWALLGGRDNFGVVTRVEIELFPVARLYGGGLYFDGATQGADVLRAYRDWTADLPEELTSSIALFPAPDVPALPEPLRGRLVVHVRVAYTGTAEEGERLVAPLRAVGPRLIDTLAEMPYTACASIFQEPDNPMPYDGDTVLLDELTEPTLEAILDVTRPGGVPCIVEVRHLGGALARRGPTPNAVGLREAAYLLGVLSPLRGPLTTDVLRPVHGRLLGAAAPSTVGRSLTFMGASGERARGAAGGAGTPVDGAGAVADAAEELVRSAYDATDHARLRALKAVYDPRNLFRLNHNIRPAELG
ncbi:TIGR03086 family metal-binding protein [Streptomyces sp. NPDC057702]|uniref:TIGR03086 family metal-binding protein n=1 Tax=unclassified Streptomyces TaxID=2593676 RepID=UPI0036C9CFB2